MQRITTQLQVRFFIIGFVFNFCICLFHFAVNVFILFLGMAWDAALKITKVRLDLFDNEEMYTFIERSIRGGISQISKRFAKANNSRCRDFDPLKPITHLIYLDANNLYGWAMSQMLPTHNFRWLSKKEINDLVLENLQDDDDIGYIFEVS